ncbi:hypothetical protein [Alkalimonas mucilaginosa]|uniref:Uncharacterized protein n=1 Tax=Alkalimonas mucilaginosa TaxID=3057676 RepID=A0ABU7JJC4_9GAMM|nr:hypothetical protein [Alkalimonas sp. MEB004]MEE2025804.1 hypothetical protein [Alkalimonas sp. MEB004]
MQELTFEQVGEVSGAGLPFILGIVAVDLAIQGIHLAYLAYVAE